TVADQQHAEEHPAKRPFEQQVDTCAHEHTGTYRESNVDHRTSSTCSSLSASAGSVSSPSSLASICRSISAPRLRKMSSISPATTKYTPISKNTEVTRCTEPRTGTSKSKM